MKVCVWLIRLSLDRDSSNAGLQRHLLSCLRESTSKAPEWMLLQGHWTGIWEKSHRKCYALSFHDYHLMGKCWADNYSKLGSCWENLLQGEVMRKWRRVVRPYYRWTVDSIIIRGDSSPWWPLRPKTFVFTCIVTLKTEKHTFKIQT